MTDGETRRLGAYVDTSAGGERVRAAAAVGRLDGVTTILSSQIEGTQSSLSDLPLHV